MKTYVLKDISKHYIMVHVIDGKEAFFGWHGTIQSYLDFLKNPAVGRVCTEETVRGGKPSRIYESKSDVFTEKEWKALTKIGVRGNLGFLGTPVFKYVS